MLVTYAKALSGRNLFVERRTFHMCEMPSSKADSNRYITNGCNEQDLLSSYSTCELIQNVRYDHVTHYLRDVMIRQLTQ